MPEKLDSRSSDLLFRNARTHNAFSGPVNDQELHELYDLLKWGPTSANMSPARFYFLRSKEAKERLRPALMGGNVEKTMAAPVVTILAYDLEFFKLMSRLFPAVPTFGDMFAKDKTLAEVNAFRNGTLQAAYFIVAARAVGLDCGPMSGFDNAKVDKEFFAGTSVKSNFLCNLGHGDPAKLHPRGPRLSFDEAAKIL
jgi:3-hydroxypropanoate dehydrogenase